MFTASNVTTVSTETSTDYVHGTQTTAVLVTELFVYFVALAIFMVGISYAGLKWKEKYGQSLWQSRWMANCIEVRDPNNDRDSSTIHRNEHIFFVDNLVDEQPANSSEDDVIRHYIENAFPIGDEVNTQVIMDCEVSETDVHVNVDVERVAEDPQEYLKNFTKDPAANNDNVEKNVYKKNINVENHMYSFE